MTEEAYGLVWFPEDDPLRCPECHEDVPRIEWIDREPPCELCGNHAGIECPRCGEVFEHVWDPQRFENYVR